MSETGIGPTLADHAGKADGATEVRRQEALLKFSKTASARANKEAKV